MVLFFFILGLSIGSFLNVLVDRLPRGESILGRSHCEFCKKTLSWKDLIPVLSFVYLRGRCRYCKVKIGLQYPLVELLTGIMFVFTYLYLNKPISNFQFQISNFSPDPVYSLLSTLYYFFVVSVMIVIFFADLKYGIIPDKVIFPAIIVSLIYIAISTLYPPPATQDSLLALRAGNSLILNHLLSAFGAFLFFLFIYLITKGRGMGFGDVKLAFLIGLVLGFPGTVLALYVAFLTGGFIGIILILWKKKKLKYAIPFGPFLVIGCLISLFFQDQISQALMLLL